MNQYSITVLPSDVLKAVATSHKKLRKQLKMSQESLAKKSGVSLGSLRRFERTGQVSFESLLKLSHVLGRLSDFEGIFKVEVDLARIGKLFSQDTR